MPVEFKIKLVQVRSSLKMTIPKEVCEALDLKKGSTVGVSLTDSKIHVRKVS